MNKLQVIRAILQRYITLTCNTKWCEVLLEMKVLNTLSETIEHILDEYSDKKMAISYDNLLKPFKLTSPDSVQMIMYVPAAYNNSEATGFGFQKLKYISDRYDSPRKENYSSVNLDIEVLNDFIAAYTSNTGYDDTSMFKLMTQGILPLNFALTSKCISYPPNYLDKYSDIPIWAPFQIAFLQSFAQYADNVNNDRNNRSFIAGRDRRMAILLFGANIIENAMLNGQFAIDNGNLKDQLNRFIIMKLPLLHNELASRNVLTTTNIINVINTAYMNSTDYAIEW